MARGGARFSGDRLDGGREEREMSSSLIPGEIRHSWIHTGLSERNGGRKHKLGSSRITPPNQVVWACLVPWLALIGYHKVTRTNKKRKGNGPAYRKSRAGAWLLGAEGSVAWDRAPRRLAPSCVNGQWPGGPRPAAGTLAAPRKGTGLRETGLWCRLGLGPARRSCLPAAPACLQPAVAGSLPAALHCPGLQFVPESPPAGSARWLCSCRTRSVPSVPLRHLIEPWLRCISQVGGSWGSEEAGLGAASGLPASKPRAAAHGHLPLLT